MDDFLTAELRHRGQRLELPVAYDNADNAYVIELPDGAGQVWFPQELTGRPAG